MASAKTSMLPTLSTSSVLKSFVVPRHHELLDVTNQRFAVVAIIPSNQPTALTLRLVRDLVHFNPNLFVYVVDDCSDQSDAHVVSLFKMMASVSTRVRVIRTPENTLKAGALNFALAEIRVHPGDPDVILTLDDDVVIEERTVQNIVQDLMSHKELGAVCSECRVYNKNANLLTRLQGLEYVGFNAIRFADRGFICGPLVMHGMLTAFRASALAEVKGFAEGHLIEDYEVTTRLKERGWQVRSATNAPAWTVVPETLPRLWRQRTRWSYGGITVVVKARSLLAVFQDFLGHSAFIATLCLVAILNVSSGSGGVPLVLAKAIIGLSLVQLGISYLFQLWLMRTYAEKDLWDWLIRLLIVPEFVYSYIMTLALLGSYIFHSFLVLKRHINIVSASMPVRFVERMFRRIGYTETQWGSRTRSV